jgi:hypothetical protein
MKEFLKLMEEGSKLDAALGTQRKGIANFDEKMSKFMDLCFNREGMASHKRRYLMKEAETTSDFPVLFGTVLERVLRSKYDLQQPDWRKYIKVGTQNDFRTAWDMATYGNRATLNVVKERGEYQDTKMQDGKFTINLQKYGRKFGLSWEAIINDDLGAFSDIASDLALAASLTEAYQATALFCGSGGPNSTLFSTSGNHPIDGASFTNKYTSSTLNGTNLLAAITALKSQKDYDGNPIMFGRIILVTPVALESTAMQVLSANLLIATNLTTSVGATVDGPFQSGTTSENILAKYPITAVVNPWLDIIDTTAGKKTWYLFGDPAYGDAVKVNFLRGHESPEVVQKMSDKISLGGAAVSPLDGDFDSDSIEWRVRHILGGTVTDPRYAQANVGS